MGINLSGIQSKVNAFANSPAGKAKIRKAILSESGTGTGSGDGIIDLEKRRQEMIIAGQEMLAIIRKHAASAGLPASVMAHAESFVAGPPNINDDGSGSLSVWMSDNAGRPSLQPSMYEPIYNIVALFNNGYDAGGVVYGSPEVEIEGQQSINGFFYVKSKQHRDGLGFMQSAVAEFNTRFGDKYNVTAKLSGTYG